MAVKKKVSKCPAEHPGCDGKKSFMCRITPARGDEIAQDARSGRNWAEEASQGPGCICGAGMRTLVAATALQGVHGRPQGQCARHPGGTVHRESDWKK